MLILCIPDDVDLKPKHVGLSKLGYVHVLVYTNDYSHTTRNE